MKNRKNTTDAIHAPTTRAPLERRIGTLLAGITLVMLATLLPPSFASAQLLLDAGEGSGQVGDTVLVPIELSDLGESVWSYELALNWNQAYASVTDVSTAGTLSNGWIVDHLAGPGTLSLSGAGGAPLPGDGTLILIEFELGPSAGSVTLYLGSAVFNEGSPVPARANGLLSITALPSLNIYPDSGLMVVGDSLSFSTTGGTAPYVYTSSDPLVADFQGDPWLHALGPGFVTARTEDADGYTDVTTGLIEVRAFTLEAQDVSTSAGNTILVPIRLDDPTTYGITSGEFNASWTGANLDFLGLETSGTLIEAAGWSAPLFLESPGGVFVTAAGATPLPGAGVLVYLRFEAWNSTHLTLTPGIFNESYPAYPVDGYVTVSVPPILGISPATADLLVGDLQLFTVSGTYVEPLTWTVDNPLLADIDTGGHLLAQAEGYVRVQVEDAVGATAESGLISICSLAVPALISSISADETVSIPVTVDRDVTGMGIYSFELEVTYAESAVEFLGATTVGTTIQPWGLPYSIDEGGLVRVAIAGAEPPAGCGAAFIFLEFRGLPGLIGDYTGVHLQSALFNEGSPCARINQGEACPYSSVEIPAAARTQLLPNHPNPFNPSTTIRFMVETPETVKLSVYSARGERVRSLVDGPVSVGVMQTVEWNGRNDSDQAVASGVYYCRLQTGDRTLIRKMALLK